MNKLWHYSIWLLGLLFILVGCDTPQPMPTLTPTTEISEPVPFEDNSALIQARFLLIFHLIEIEKQEGVPFVDQWVPDGMYSQPDSEIYNFTANTWQLTLQKPEEDTDKPYDYLATMSNDEGFSYTAEIRGEEVYPTQ